MTAVDNDIHKIAVRAPAKLNLFLQITGKRENGYHDLQTLFQLTDQADTLVFEKTESKTTLSDAIPGVESADNLIVRAAKLLKIHTNYPGGAQISLKKILPMGGGLGGGSSDAASTLLALNALWQTNLPLAELSALGATLGADVPVFIGGQSCLAEGIGEVLYPVELEEIYYLVLKPPIEVSTATIFGHPRLTRDSLAIRIAAFFQQADLSARSNFYSQDPPKSNREQALLISQWQSNLGNDCESVVRALHPDVDTALRWLGTHAQARLTGTGSCIFAAFASRPEAENVLALAPAELQGFVCQGNNVSCAHRDIAEWQSAVL